MQIMFTGRDLSMSLKSPLLYFSFPTIRFRRARALGPERPHCVCRVDRTSSWKRRSDAGLGQSRGPVLAGPLPGGMVRLQGAGPRAVLLSHSQPPTVFARPFPRGAVCQVEGFWFRCPSPLLLR